jgi:hypothetical protein
LGKSNIVEIAIKVPTGFAASVIFYRERRDAHGEEIELCAGRIRGVMVECGEMLLVELQQKLGLNLVDLWLGLLLGDTGCVVSRRVNCEVEFGVNFYDRQGIWIVELLGGEKDREI